MSKAAEAPPAPPNNPPVAPAEPPKPPEAPPANQTPPEGTPPVETPPAPPEAPPEIVSGRDDPLLAALWRDTGVEREIKPVPDPAPPPPEPTPEEKAKLEADAAAKAEAEAKAKTEADKLAKPPKKKRVTILPDEEPVPVEVPIAQPTQPAPAPRAEPAPDPDAAYVASLTDEQVEELKDAQFAEANMPQKYQGWSKKLVDFYKKFDAWVTKAREEQPERTFDESDTGYVEFMRANKPRFAVGDSKKIMAGRIRAEVEESAQKAVEPQLKEIQLKQKEIEARPKVESIVQQFTDGFHDLLIDKKRGDNDTVAAAAEALRKDPAKIPQELTMEADMLDEARKRWEPLAREYMRFAYEVVKYDDKDPVHRELMDFVSEEGERFAAQGGKYRVRDGKTFLPRAKYAQLLRTNPDEAKNKFWTFNHRMVLEIMAVRAKNEVHQAVEAEHKRRERYGWAPKPTTAPAENGKPTPEPAPVNPPLARASAAPGPSNQQPPATVDPNAIDVRRTLYPEPA